MTTYGFRLQSAMDEAWRFEGRTPTARASMERFAAKYAELNMVATIDLCDLVQSLGRGGLRPREEKWEIINKMLVEAADKKIAAALVQTLLPGLVNECASLKWGQGVPEAPEQMLAVTVAKATDIVDRWAGEQRQYALPDLLSAARSGVRRWLLKEKQATSAVSLDDPTLQRLTPLPSTDRLATRLESFAGTKHEREARLVHARVYAGVPARSLAREERVSAGRLQQSLENFVRDHLLE
jgi:hypothetical protein